MRMKWISVKEKLPEKCGMYWVCCLINGRLKTHYCFWAEHSRTYKGNKFGWRSRGYVRRSNITHWMPLPTPPINLENKIKEVTNER